MSWVLYWLLRCYPLLPVPKSIQRSRTRYVIFHARAGGFAPSNMSIFSGSVGLVQRFGQFYKSVDPGLVQVNVCTESVRVVDVKIQISPIGRQTVM
jgi:hypothetical protein